MLNSPTRTIFSEITEFLATNPAPEAIIAYRLPDELEARAALLFEKHGEGALSPDEHEELMDFIRVDEMMSLLKAKMRVKLAREKP